MDSSDDLHVKRLRGALNDTAALKPLNIYAAEFKRWERRASQALEELYGSDHSYSSSFSSLQFWHARVVVEPNEWTDWDQEKYEADLLEAKDILRDAIEEWESRPEGGASALRTGRTIQGIELPRGGEARPFVTPNPRDVAVVQGRDSEVTDAVYDFLRSLDLHPREWEELLKQATSATPYTGHLVDQLFEDVQAVVVILSPDDEARLHPDLQGKDDAVQEARFFCQARPNVIFEAGMAFGLYPDRSILVEVGELRPMSDLLGRHTVRLGAANAIKSFVNRLLAAGCAVNTDGAHWLKPGRFSDLAALTRRPLARLEVVEEPSRIFPTSIWLNPWVVGAKDEVTSVADEERQTHPVVARTLKRDLGRSASDWSLLSKKDGPNALLRLKGQVNLQAQGGSDMRILLVQQRFAVDGRPIPNPPDAGPMGFAMIPGQEINVSFEASVPDREYGEGELLYGMKVLYENEAGDRLPPLEVFWWYDFNEDKWWNNLNKVPYFESIRKNFW